MARPTIEQQKIIGARNDAIIDLVVRKGFSQSEVGRFFNISRATVNQVVTDYKRPKTLGDKLLKEYIFNKLVEGEKSKENDCAKALGIEWRSNRTCGVYMDYPINKSAASGSNMGALWDEVLHWVEADSWENGMYPSTEKEIEMVEGLKEDDMDIIRSEDIVITHKGSVYAIIRIGESFGDDEYAGIPCRLVIPSSVVLSLEDLEDLTTYETF